MKRTEMERIIRYGVEKEKCISEIAEQCKTSRNTVYKYMRRMGLEYRGQREFNLDKLVEMLKSGNTYEEIAEDFGLTKEAVQYHVAKNNLKGVAILSRREIRETKRQEQEKLKAMKNKENEQKKPETNYKYCKRSAISSTKKTCLYGGRLGVCDCCDYFELTGKRRKYEKGKPEHCYCYKEATKSEKERFRRSIKENCSAVMVLGKE